MATTAAPKTCAKSFAVTALMYSSERYSDLVIYCQDKTFKIHRNVVCLQSKVISRMVDSDFVEGKSGVVKLPENDPNSVKKMIEYMYLGDYSDGRGQLATMPVALESEPEALDDGWGFAKKGIKSSKKKKGKQVDVQEESSSTPATSSTLATSTLATSSLLASSFASTEDVKEPDFIKEWPSDWIGAPFLNAQVYVIAEQYDIPSLKQLAKEKYAEVIPTEWNSASFVASIQLMYDNTPESDRLLKDVALKVVGEHAKELVDRGEFVLLCKENGEIGVDFLKACLSAASSARCCHYCGQITHIPAASSHFYCGNCGRMINC